MHHPGPVPNSVSSTRLFACVERTKVSNSSYSRDPRIRGSFRHLAPSCTSKGTSNIISGVNSLNVVHQPGLLQTAVSCARLFARVERTKVPNSSYSRDPRICASFRPLASSCTSKGRSNNISGVNSLKIFHLPGLLPTSVSCTRLFACVERTKVSNSSYSRDPRIRGSFRPLALSCTSK